MVADTSATNTQKKNQSVIALQFTVTTFQVEWDTQAVILKLTKICCYWNTPQIPQGNEQIRPPPPPTNTVSTLYLQRNTYTTLLIGQCSQPMQHRRNITWWLKRSASQCNSLWQRYRYIEGRTQYFFDWTMFAAGDLAVPDLGTIVPNAGFIMKLSPTANMKRKCPAHEKQVSNTIVVSKKCPQTTPRDRRAYRSSWGKTTQNIRQL